MFLSIREKNYWIYIDCYFLKIYNKTGGIIMRKNSIKLKNEKTNEKLNVDKSKIRVNANAGRLKIMKKIITDNRNVLEKLSKY